MNVFVDTSGILAILNADDRYHGEAATIWQNLVKERVRLVTTSCVLVETYSLAQSRLGLTATQAIASDFQPLVDIVWIANEHHQAAISALLAANRRQLSLVDCVSFEIMRIQHISQAFAFDPHFLEQGFTRPYS